MFIVALDFGNEEWFVTPNFVLLPRLDGHKLNACVFNPSKGYTHDIMQRFNSQRNAAQKPLDQRWILFILLKQVEQAKLKFAVHTV